MATHALTATDLRYLAEMREIGDINLWKGSTPTKEARLNRLVELGLAKVSHERPTSIAYRATEGGN